MIARRAVGAAWLIALAATASAQTLPFQLLFTQGQNAETLSNGSQVTFLSAVGQSQTAQLQVMYSGGGQATIAAPPVVTGSLAFTANLTSAVPAVLKAGGEVNMTIAFTPTSAASTTAQISLPYMESVATGTTNTGTITISLLGTAPSFVLSYTLQTNQNVVPLQPGGRIQFAPTLVGATAQAALTVTNTGSGAGSVTGITATGSAFAVQGIPLLPATLGANQTMTVQVLYTPSAVASDSGQIVITFSAGPNVTINLSGSGTAPTFTYQLLNTSPPTAVAAGGAITLPDTQVGQTSSLSVRVLNSGNAPGTVSSINIAGQGFTLSTVPVLPQTLAVGASLTFTVNFAPTQPGAATGSLIINSVSFTLNGNGLGAQLTYSYVTGGATITLSATNNSMVFSPVQITQSGQLSLDVKNTGTVAATISNIGVGQSGSPFTVSGLPNLPVTLAPNADFHVTITFTPVSLGFSNGTLLFDSTSVALVGSGTAPPPLPAYTISGPTGNAAPMTQPSIGLTLASGYPVAVSGTLTLTTAGTLPVDPAVQFATGGQTIAFVIPANQTSAVFSSAGTAVGIQTGTVAGNVTLTPTFQTQAGGVSLTPASPQTLQFTVAAAAPTLLAVQITGATLTSFTVQVTGYATSRTLSSMVVQFTTAAGFSMPTSQFTIDVSSLSTLWFGSTASHTYGSQFTLAVPFTFQASLPATKSIVAAISSVSVTMTNGTGTSNAVQTTVP